MVLFVIGLGLADEHDITLKGFEAVKSSERIYLESYTSILMVPGFKERLEKLYQKPVILAHRETVELEADSILQGAATANVAFLVVGDPLSATTHTDLILRAKQSSPSIPVKIIHNASIMTAIGSSGLAGYNFGQTVSVPFWSEDWKPDSWLERIGENLRIGLHTLALSDIKVREQSAQDMSRGILRYQDPRYMLIPQLISQILSAARSHSVDYLHPDHTLAIALCRMGSEEERIVSGTLQELLDMANPSEQEARAEEAEDDADELASEAELDKRRAARAEARAKKAFGEPLHSLVIVGKRLHPLERDYAASYACPASKFLAVAQDDYACKE
ncbi:probable DPH5 - diphthamide methyltransferase [Melanopsichium pennsylvanicum]|uniref:diphthine methyl ester synthase n=2 Tax=Melanopsichium pennsylvanicum TaxID=63383 RepID=A0AAJ4XLK9_9BASI|nr:probable DPH5-diphthamide methyltransferase [Melanopsichium pennsylvanicum 4]SNX83996.1 probable DPH5 - diphthamide methyltransferase [Melanopsichium pennsylvanicum]